MWPVMLMLSVVGGATAGTLLGLLVTLALHAGFTS